MPGPSLMLRARSMWESLAGAPVVFTAGVTVIASPQSRLCPPSWIGIVVLGDGAIATAPDADSAEMVRRVLSRLPMTALTEVGQLRTQLAVLDALGPATLSYLSRHEFRPDTGMVAPRELETGDAIRTLVSAVDSSDAEESGLQEITSPAFVVSERGRVVAAAGYRNWPGKVAHMSVLVAPPARGRGLARQVASAALAHALRDGQLPQWRARHEPSRQVARALGFRELGAQLSLRLG